MTHWLLPALFAIFIWWFSTGVVILLDGLPHRTFRWSLVLSSGLAVAALLGLAHTATQDTVAGAYCAFTCALLLWGWHELSFLTGWITGPRKGSHTRGCSRWRHAMQAIQVILWHELWLLLSLSLLAAMTWGQVNTVGFWTFCVLWCMRASAKLNLFLGVRNLGLEFLPAHLAYLRHYFRQAPMNLLFPVSVTAATMAATWGIDQALLAPPGSAQAIGHLLVATILTLGVLEHWMLVLPVTPAALWRWALRPAHGASPEAPDPQVPSDSVRSNTLPLSIDRAETPAATGTALRIPADEKLLHARSA